MGLNLLFTDMYSAHTKKLYCSAFSFPETTIPRKHNSPKLYFAETTIPRKDNSSKALYWLWHRYICNAVFKWVPCHKTHLMHVIKNALGLKQNMLRPRLSFGPKLNCFSLFEWSIKQNNYNLVKWNLYPFSLYLLIKPTHNYIMTMRL